MKKLLSILGAMTLIGTASTSVIACGGGEKPNPPTPDTRTDKEICNFINMIKYKVEIDYSINEKTFENDTIEKIKSKITGQFIKDGINNKTFKKSFDSGKFVLLSITKNDGNLVNNNDLDYGTSLEDSKIFYNYGLMKNQKFNFKINIRDATKYDIIKNINSYNISQEENSNAVNELEQKIKQNNFQFIKDGIKSIKIKNMFIEQNFIITSITKNNHEDIINNNDFKKGQQLKTIINFIYYPNGTSKNGYSAYCYLTINVI